MKGKEYELAIRIAGIVDKSLPESLKSAERNLMKLDKDFVKLDKAFDGVGKVGSKAFQAVEVAAATATAAIGAVTAASVHAGMDFEKQMSAVQAISGASGREFEALTNTARKLAQSSAFSASEVGEAMEYMGMAGWKTEQILAGIEGVMNLAAASGEDLAAVSDIVTDDLTAFHMEAEEASRMVDVMAQAAMNSNTNVAMMGETFKYSGALAGAMGYQIEDVAIATGLMASSGIKASEAGTALRSIITRMTDPTKDSAEAMEALGLSLTREDGSMYSFLEIMEQMRAGMSGMTEAEKAYYAAGLAGKMGMSGLLAIADSTDKQFEELTAAIYNAEGAARRMADIRLDNLAGDVQIFQDALTDAGIELYQELNGPLRSLVQMGTGWINEAAAQIPEAVSKISEEFPSLQRKFKKFAKPVFLEVMNVGKWIEGHGKGIISVISGIGASLAAYKAVSGAAHVFNGIASGVMKMLPLLSSLSPLTFGLMELVAVLGLFTKASVEHKLRVKELVDQNLAKHFGDIALSMEELDKVAKHILSDENLKLLGEMGKAFDNLDEIADSISGSISALNKMNWKLSIGMDLKPEEMETYQNEINTFISNCQEYALQQQYAVTLSVRTLISDEGLEGTNIVDTINRFYADKQGDLSRLGGELAAVITDAFADGLFEVEEMEQVIKIQQQMADIQNALADSEFDAALTTMEYKFSGAGLTPDTFRNLLDELEVQAGESIGKYDEAFRSAMQQAELMKKEGYFENDTAYQEYTDQLYAGYLDNVSKVRAKILQFATDTVKDTGIIDNATAEAWDIISKQMTPGLVSHYAENYGDNWVIELRNHLLSNDTLKELTELQYESLWGDSGLMPGITTQNDALAAIEEEYRKLGKDIPQWVAEGLGDFEALSLLSGRLTDYLMGLKLATDAELEEYAELARNADLGATRSIAEGLAGADSEMQDIVTKLYEAREEALRSRINGINESILPMVEETYVKAQETLNEYFTPGFQTVADVVISLNPIFRYNQTNVPVFQGLNNLNIDQNADGGIIWNTELSWLAEKGPEAVIPLDGSRNAVSLWKKAGQFLGMGSVFDGLELDGGGDTVTIEYCPSYQFYGEAPSKQDMVDAASISQEEFNRMMDQYLKHRSRVSFR